LAGTGLLIGVALVLSYHLEESVRGATALRALSTGLGAILLLVMILATRWYHSKKAKVLGGIEEQWTLFRKDDPA
jgi:hypothetical protein